MSETKHCQSCFKEFTKGEHDDSTRWRIRKYCTTECYRNMVKRMTWLAR